LDIDILITNPADIYNISDNHFVHLVRSASYAEKHLNYFQLIEIQNIFINIEAFFGV